MLSFARVIEGKVNKVEVNKKKKLIKLNTVRYRIPF